MKSLLTIVAFIFVAITMTGCAGFKEWSKDVMEPKTVYDEVHENHLALAKQRLIPRPGHEGKLTNQVCLKFYGDKCEQKSLKEYDLQDANIRKQLNEFKIACNVGGKRYRICKDEPGLCRSEKVCVKWGKTLFQRKKVCREHGVKKTVLHAVNDYEFLLNGATECKQGL